MTTCSCPAVVDVTIMRPDLKFQLGFSVKEGNVRRERGSRKRDRREKRERDRERQRVASKAFISHLFPPPPTPPPFLSLRYAPYGEAL